MAKLNVEIIHPQNAEVNLILSQMERKYAHRKLTSETIDEMEREAARLIRRLITTKVTFVK
ncbi:hypothetical protein MUA04_24015 [Enterobacteriaceae bacterium H11S18]|uniref:hypothetical protein n=1 Tax=Dryocola clanedunensis TaxID=2925396 RepID=UPI0022F0A242|nr:hypothetical protein [Dryocola clanedunensis]MCT4713238.1 hypothetical protein [Dryocola clanedunensis]